jgi:O-glycosyl hydrolase
MRTTFAAAAVTVLVAGLGTAAGSPPAQAADAYTVRPDPSYQGQPFEGWGTSLAWFAEATGNYPDEIRERLADLVFGEQGLNLNIARYNIGGGNAPDVPEYLRAGGAVPGWWQAPAGTTRDDVDWWDPDNPAHWNFGADPAQRWWVDEIKNRVTRWETFSNSPPWFQTVSGYVSGGFDANQDQIRADKVDEFATYLTRVTRELEKAHHIHVDTIEPVNEPNTPYWSTRLGPDGNPVGGRQEGAHAGPALQQQIITALDKQTRTKIAAMDETNPAVFATDWNAYSEAVRKKVDRLNVHTYGTNQRTTVRDIAKGEQKPLWMSEVEGSWGDGQSFTDMAPGLGMAQHMVDDLRELEPSAWVFWQPVEDYNNMKPGGESAAGANWGSIQIPFDCTAADTLRTCPIYTNTKFNTVRNFTHYVQPGDRLIKVGDTSSVAALSGGDRATVVHVNDTDSARTVRLDLSAFGKVARTATVTPVVTSAAGALRKQKAVPVRAGSAIIDVPAKSVTTFLIRGVSGAAKPDGHVFALAGVQSGKFLRPNGSGTDVVISSQAAQWRLTKLTPGTSNRARYTVTTAAGERRLAVKDTATAGNAAVLEPARGRPTANAQWILSTTGDGTYTLVNVGTKRLLDVPGQATTEGAPVGTWTANSGDNQRWRQLDVSVD